MKFDYLRLFKDFGVIYSPSGQSRGFISLQCPFCQGKYSDKFYGGLNQVEDYYNCWKCGWHGFNALFLALTGLKWESIKKNYRTEFDFREAYLEKHAKPRPDKLILPADTAIIPLQDCHKDYLVKRGFDPVQLEKEYQIQATGNVGRYSHRIFIPIFFDGEMISFTTRDFTGKSSIRYYSCKEENELIPHKNILYGYDTCPKSHAIVVEGVMDKWKMGKRAVATFGAKFTEPQVGLLSEFKKVSILFDPEEEAMAQAEALARELDSCGVWAEVVDLKEGDPGELSREEAKNLVKEILL